MDYEDPCNIGGAAIVIISFSIIKRVHICGLPLSMILQKKIICKTEIGIDKNTFNAYKDKIKKAKIKHHLKINHNVYTYTKVKNQKNKSKN